MFGFWEDRTAAVGQEAVRRGVESRTQDCPHIGRQCTCALHIQRIVPPRADVICCLLCLQGVDTGSILGFWKLAVDERGCVREVWCLRQATTPELESQVSSWATAVTSSVLAVLCSIALHSSAVQG